jgi:hypothetical protein
VGVSSIRWWAIQHPVLSVRREVMLCLPSTGARPIKRARYRVNQCFYEALEFYKDLWNAGEVAW